MMQNINIGGILKEIRQEALGRKGIIRNDSANGKNKFCDSPKINCSRSHETDEAGTEALQRYRKQVHIGELLHFDDIEFINNAYLTILNRRPDRNGSTFYLSKLRNKEFDKIKVITHLRYSAEGRKVGIVVKGLFRPMAAGKIYAIPLIGPLLKRVRSSFF